jgi:hypothetical protein
MRADEISAARGRYGEPCARVLRNFADGVRRFAPHATRLRTYICPTTPGPKASEILGCGASFRGSSRSRTRTTGLRSFLAEVSTQNAKRVVFGNRRDQQQEPNTQKEPACPLCRQPMEVVADGKERTHACGALQNILHEAGANLRYNNEPPLDDDSGYKACPVPEGILKDLYDDV